MNKHFTPVKKYVWILLFYSTQHNPLPKYFIYRQKCFVFLEKVFDLVSEMRWSQEMLEFRQVRLENKKDWQKKLVTGGEKMPT